MNPEGLRPEAAAESAKDWDGEDWTHGVLYQVAVEDLAEDEMDMQTVEDKFAGLDMGGIVETGGEID